jgi:co-chaperonin GroES (HSP10)
MVIKRNETRSLVDVTDASFPVTDKRRRSDPTYLERLGEELKPKREEAELTLDAKIDDCYLEPGPGRVVVQPDAFKYKGHMIIPDNAKRNGTTGVVLKVGQGCTMEFWHPQTEENDGTISPGMWRPLSPGDRVVYATWTGTALTFEGRPSYRVLAENEVCSLVINKTAKLLDVEA